MTDEATARFPAQFRIGETYVTLRFLRLSDRERSRKRAAIECHQTQLILSRERFLAYARPIEEFFKPEFDLVCTESRTRERAAAFRHSCRVLLGRSSPTRGEDQEAPGDPATDPEIH